MSTLEVRPVTSWLDRRRFLNFPWSLYRGDAHWVPPLRSSQPPLLGYRPHPFLANGEIQTFLACHGRQVVGQIAAIVNHAHDREYRERRGFFGFFESIDDRRVSCAVRHACATGSRVPRCVRAARASESLDELHQRHAGRWLRQCADVLFALQPRVLSRPARRLWFSQGPRHAGVRRLQGRAAAVPKESRSAHRSGH